MDWPDGKAKRVFMQINFLCGVNQYAREACEELYAGPFALYQQLGLDSRLTWEWFSCPPSNRLPNSRALLTSLEEWARNRNLEAEWCLKCAYETLRFWFLCPTSAERFEFHGLPNFSYGYGSNVPQPPDGLPKYAPLLNSRGQYLDGLRSEAKRRAENDAYFKLGHLVARRRFVDTIIRRADKYCDQVETAYKAMGYVTGDKKRNLTQHLEWTVRFQVKGEKETEIARQTQLATGKATRRVTPQAVSKAVKTFLKDIDLKSRLDL